MQIEKPRSYEIARSTIEICDESCARRFERTLLRARTEFVNLNVKRR